MCKCVRMRIGVRVGMGVRVQLRLRKRCRCRRGQRTVGRIRTDASRRRRRRARRSSVGPFTDPRSARHDIPETISFVSVEVAMLLQLFVPPLQLLDPPLQFPVLAFQLLQSGLLFLLPLLLPLPESRRCPRVSLPLLVRLLGCLMVVDRNQYLGTVVRCDSQDVLLSFPKLKMPCHRSSGRK